MSRQSHGMRPENLREDSYFMELDQILLANLREAMQLQREAAECAANGRRNEHASSFDRTEEHGLTAVG